MRKGSVNDRHSRVVMPAPLFPKDSQKLLSGFTISKMLLGIDWNARRVCHTDQSITCRSLVDARSSSATVHLPSGIEGLLKFMAPVLCLLLSTYLRSNVLKTKPLAFIVL